MILSFFGLVIYGLCVSGDDVGIVAMTRPSGNIPSYPTLNFTLVQKGVILSAGAYGYTIGALIFGYLTDFHGPMTISPIAGGICCGLLNLIYPSLCVYGGYTNAVSMRVLQGFLTSCIYPGVYVHMSNWVAPQEQAKFSWVWTGHTVGHLILSMVVGPLAESAAGWPAIYQFVGSMAIIWGFFTLRWGVDCPMHHKTISHEEKMITEKHLPQSRVGISKRTPWLDMLKSLPLWTFLIVQTLDWFVAAMVYPFQATYLTGVFNLSIHEAGLAVAYADMVQIPTSFLFTYLATTMEGSMSINFSRKLWNSIANFGEGIIFLILAFTQQGPTYSTVLFMIAHSLSSAINVGYVINVLDFAPNFAGTVTGSLTTISNIGWSFGGIATGLLVHDEADIESWRQVFVLGAIVLFTGNLIFLTFGSTKLERWNNFNEGQYEAEKLLD